MSSSVLNKLIYETFSFNRRFIMSLTSFKRAACSAIFLSTVFFSQQIFAEERDLFCSNKDSTDYPWSSTTKEVPPLLAKIAYKNGDKLTLKGSLWARWWRPTFTITVQKSDVYPNKELYPNLAGAKAICQELQTFCNAGRKMIGASRKSGSWNSIVVDFKHNPNDENEDPSALICPNWFDHNGLVYPALDGGQSQPYSANMPIPE